MSLKKAYLMFTFSTLFIFSLIITVKTVKASVISSPAIIESGSIRNENGIGAPFVKGLTPNNTEVLVYIDGSFISLANLGDKGTTTDSFFYQYPITLAGNHEIMLIARDKTSLVLSAPVVVIFEAPVLPGPTLVMPTVEEVIGTARPFITGLTVSNTEVLLYIDGVYNGKIKPDLHRSGTANFAYKPTFDLKIGSHQVWAVAEDALGRKSRVSDVMNFKVSAPTPSPTLISPINNIEVIENSPKITGLAKNDSLIKIFVDSKLDGKFEVVNHESGVANFSYSPSFALTKGKHSVFATATDKQGKESKSSNLANFTVRLPSISLDAEEAVAGIKEVEAKNEIQDADVKKIIDENIDKENRGKGLLNENQEGQSKLKLNLIIFIAFLMGIIAWIFWVNKELIKEKNNIDETDKDIEEKDI